MDELSPEQTSPDVPTSAHGTRRLVCGIFVAGTMLRFGVVAFSSPEYSLPFWDGYGWPADHGTYVQWARQATAPDAGLWTMYTRPAEPGFEVQLSFGKTFIHHGKGELANYPPLGLYLVYLQGVLHRILDPALVVNTAVARAVFDLFALIGDIILAWGAWRLAERLFGGRAGIIALTVVYLIPPIWLDSCWWGQTDSWMLAPTVWIIWALVRRRWLLAGLLWGIALSLKPQAILLAPLWLFAGLVSLAPSWRQRFGSASRRDRAMIVCSVVFAVAVLNLTALPFWVTSGDAWLQQSYLRNLSDEGPHTTLKAFNIWYVDLLRTYDTDVTQKIAGVTKDTWGKTLAMLGLIASGVIAWRSRWPVHHRIVLFAGLWLLAVVMLATRVHERYIVMCLPPLAIAATGARRLWPGLVGLILVGCFQVTVFHWLNPPADGWVKKLRDDTILHHREAVAQTPPEYANQLPTLEQALAMRFENFVNEHRHIAPYEWGVTMLALAATLATFAGAARQPSRASPTRPADGSPETTGPPVPAPSDVIGV